MKRNKIALLLAATMLVTALSCETYQSPGKTGAVEHDKDFGDFSMHYYELGKGPVVVFSGGSGVNDPFYDLRKVIMPISGSAKTITYERSGYGKSSQAPQPIDIDKMVENLNALLADNEAKEPVLLVGHSFAALELIRFAQKYPARVKAIVLIDGAPPTYYRTWEPGPIENLPKLIQNEAKILKSNAEKVIAGGSIGNIPLVYFVSGSNGIKGWSEMQNEFESYSQNAKRIFVQSANHFIHWSDSDKIIAEIEKLLGP